MTTLHDKALEAACKATVLGEDENYKPVHLELREAQTAISAYLSSIGGVVCAREPTLFVSEQQLGAVGGYLPTRSMPEGNFQLSLHTPIEAGNGGDGHVLAPRGGMEPNWWGEWVKTTRAYNALAKAAQAVIDETDRTHDSEPAPVRYRAPYGAITRLREVLALSDRSSLVGHGGDGWLPIETAPKDGTQIDLWGINLLHHAKKGERIVNVGWGPVIDWMGRERDDWQHGRGGDFQPTHWRPLPSPPSPSNEGEKP